MQGGPLSKLRLTRNGGAETEWIPGTEAFLTSFTGLLMPALIDLNNRVVLVDRFKAHVEAPKPDDVLQHFIDAFIQRHAVMLRVPQGQRPVSFQIDVVNLDVGFVAAQIVLLG